MGIHPQIELGSLGMADSLILMVLALVVFGPRRLPQIGRQIGKLMYEFRKASNDFKYQMEEELRLSEEADRRKKEEEQRKQLSQESVSATPAVANAIESTSGVTATAPVDTEARPDDEMPRIMPPSTGEPVAATSGTQQIDGPTDAQTDAPTELKAEAEPPVGEAGPVVTTREEGLAEAKDPAPATEAVSQNG